MTLHLKIGRRLAPPAPGERSEETAIHPPPMAATPPVSVAESTVLPQAKPAGQAADATVAGLAPARQLVEHLKPGLLVGGFRLLRRIGVGGMGVVFRVRPETGGPEMAMKFLVASGSAAKHAERFSAEAELIRHLDHNGIVKVHQVGHDGQHAWLVMDLFLGPHDLPVNLGDYARDFGAGTGVLDPADARDIFMALLDALAYAHAGGVIHCDLKPANILLHCVGQREAYWQAYLKLTDFGLARLIGESQVHESVTQSLHRAGQGGTLTEDVRALLGTWDYMSPEQRRGEPATPLSDLYAIGLMLYRLLTGRQEPALRRPSDLRPGLDPAWDTLLLRALREQPERRFPDAITMAAALDAIPTPPISD